MKEMYNELRDRKRVAKDLFGIPCPRCLKDRPNAFATILLPQWTCKIHGYQDTRTWQDIAVELKEKAEQPVALTVEYTALDGSTHRIPKAVEADIDTLKERAVMAGKDGN